MVKVEYRGKTYGSLGDTGIPEMGGTRSFMNRLKGLSERSIPPVAFKRFEGLKFLTYRGATLPPSGETYHHARNIALVISEMARDERQPKPLVVADIGTGSGVIAITIAHSLPFETGGENPNVRVVATDISGLALEVASLNAMVNDTSQIEFRQRNLLDGLVGEFGKLDVIVSNPPYSCSGGINDRYLANDFIPRIALDGGADSFGLHRGLLEGARTALSDTGILFFEHMSYRIPDLASLAGTMMPSAAALAINGSKSCFTATAVGNVDTLTILQKYSGGKFIFR